MGRITTFGIAVAAVLAVSGNAQALEVKKTIEMDGTVADVWAKIGGWCDLAKWHPAIAKCEEVKDAKGLHRVLTTKDGGVIKETQTSAEKTGYSYRIDESPLPVADYTASLSAEAGKKGKVNVVWSAKFSEKKGVKAADATKVIEGVFSGLDVAKGVK